MPNKTTESYDGQLLDADQTTQIAEPRGRRSVWPRAGVAAAALVATCGIGFAALTGGGVMAGGNPVQNNQGPAVSAPADAPAIRTIPAGKYLVESISIEQKADKGGLGGAPNGDFKSQKQTRTTVIDSKGNMTLKFGGHAWDGQSIAGERTDMKATPARDYAQAPSDAAALKSWFLKAKSEGNSRSDADVLYTGVTDALRDPMSSAAFRQRAVAALQGNADTTVEYVTVNGAKAVKLTFTNNYEADGAFPSTVGVRSTTLDAASMNVLEESNVSKTTDGKLISQDVQKTTRALEITSKP